MLLHSVAVKYSHRTIGILLTGLFENGTSRMNSIECSGGIYSIQGPEEAQFSEIPQSVLNKIEVHYQAKLKTIPDILNEILITPLPPENPISRELQIEAEHNRKIDD